MQIWENVVHFCVGLRLFEISAYIQKRIFTKTVKKIIEIGRIVPAEKRIRIAVYKHERFCLIKWGNNVCLMLNFCLRDSFIKLFHHNRHFSIKGKTSVTFPNFPSPRVIKFLESLSIFTLSVPVESLGMSLLLPQHYLKNWLTLFYFSSANEAIFLFHVLFDATVGETSLDFFFWQKTVFLRLSVFSFFSWTSSSWAFFFICFISSLFHLFRASLWRLFASSDLFQLKKKYRK